MKKRISRVVLTALMTMTMVLSGAISSFAAAPYIEEIDYNSKGRVEVEFYGKVRYKKVKVSVKDTSGKKYKVKAIRRDDDDIKFTINNFKPGKTYKITVKGVKTRGSKKFGKVTGKLKVPGGTVGTNITAQAALKKAQEHATKTYGASNFWDVEVDSDREMGQPIWEVSFNGTINGMPYEFDYDITKKGGKIIKAEHEYDD